MTTRYPFSLIKEKLAARQGQALDFAIGQRPVPLPEPIAEWIHGHTELALKPSSHADTRAFCAAAAALLQREYAVAIEPDCILPTPGGRAAMSAFVACTLEPGQGVIVTEPGYPAFLRLATHRHATIHALELDPAKEFAPDVAPVRDQTGAVRVIALNYPNNPSGAPLSQQMLHGLEAVAGSETILFNDATYGPLVYDRRPQSLLHPDVSVPNGAKKIELHSFSKLFPIGPLAVSFLAGSAVTMASISTYSEFAWSPLSQLALRATTLCLQDADRLAELRAFFPGQLQELRQTLVEIGLDPYPAPAGVYAICPTPAQLGGRAVSSAGEAAARLMDEFDLAVVPWDSGRHSYLRFSSLYQPADLARLAGLKDALQLA